MIDGVIKADGTSRLMRANLPATYEEFKARAAAGTLPLDVLFNAAGWSQFPTFLNKANLLRDNTAALFGLGADAVPDDVLALIPDLVAGRAQIATGSYTGTGTSGSSNPNTLTFDFKPKIVLISAASGFDGGSVGDSSYSVRQYHPAIAIRGQTQGFNNGYIHVNSWTEVKTTITWTDNGLKWYFSMSGYGAHQMNAPGTVYHYVAIG